MYYYFAEAYEKELKQKRFSLMNPQVSPPKQKNIPKKRVEKVSVREQTMKIEIITEVREIERPIQIIEVAQPMDVQEQPDLPVRLVLCPEGCERSFNEKAIQRHIKVCKKTQSEQRAVFDSKAQREAEGLEDVSYVNNNAKGGKPIQKKKKQSKVNWKEQSEAFRLIIQGSKNPDVKMTPEQEEAIKKATTGDLVQCDYCARKFNETTALKHIPFCKQQQILKKNKNKK